MKKMEMGILFTGTVYRAPSGYRHDSGLTVADVLRYEEEELGNVGERKPAPSSVLQEPARNCAWVTLKREDALMYGDEIETIEVHSAWVVAEDGDGGYLMVYPHLQS